MRIISADQIRPKLLRHFPNSRPLRWLVKEVLHFERVFIKVEHPGLIDGQIDELEALRERGHSTGRRFPFGLTNPHKCLIHPFVWYTLGSQKLRCISSLHGTGCFHGK